MNRIIHDLREPGVQGVYVGVFQAPFPQTCHPRADLRRPEAANRVRSELHDDPADMYLRLPDRRRPVGAVAFQPGPAPFCDGYARLSGVNVCAARYIDLHLGGVLLSLGLLAECSRALPPGRVDQGGALRRAAGPASAAGSALGGPPAARRAALVTALDRIGYRHDADARVPSSSLSIVQLAATASRAALRAVACDRLRRP